MFMRARALTPNGCDLFGCLDPIARGMIET